MQTYIIIVSIFILLGGTIAFQKKVNTKKLLALIKGQYGKKPMASKYDYERASYHWDEFSKSVPDDEKIDDVSWNDLEMNGVFSRMNQCNSFVGEQTLYARLHCLPKSNSSRILLEKKINFFTSRTQEREDMQLLLSGLGKDAVGYYLPSFISSLDKFEIADVWKYRLMQILLVLSVLPALVSQNVTYLFVTAGVFAVNLIIYTLKKIKFDIHFETLSVIINLVKVGSQIAESKKLTYENEFHEFKEIVVIFKKLAHMLSRIQRKKEAIWNGNIEGIIYDYMVGATLSDFVKYDQIIRMLEGRQKEFMALFEKIGEIDMAIAVASFRESLPLFCTPTFNEEKVLQMDQIYHPLIDEPVCNTVTFDSSCIITGSNASGKSTFIKAVAINIILAQSIHTCMAKEMILPYARMITSMAVRDDLMSGESYYIKEIKYLNRIVQNLSDDRLLICAIDEILRGTNTEERIAASSAILKFLDKRNCIALVASHDIELTTILHQTYENYHFCEIIQEKDIVFDYQIHKGATTTKNAIKLLEYVGFPDEIILEARRPFMLL